MLKIGLTGGIGSGKSVVANLFEEWGASIIDTDAIAHSLTAPKGQAMAAIKEQFGSQFVTPQGALNRTIMRQHIFSQTGERERLQSILHPLINTAALEMAKNAHGCYVVFVVPLLVESDHWPKRVDRICVVDCEETVQIQRVQARSGLTPEAIRRIMSVQASREQRLAAATDVIVNNSQTTFSMLRTQAWQLHNKWLGLSY